MFNKKCQILFKQSWNLLAQSSKNWNLWVLYSRALVLKGVEFPEIYEFKNLSLRSWHLSPEFPKFQKICEPLPPKEPSLNLSLQSWPLAQSSIKNYLDQWTSPFKIILGCGRPNNYFWTIYICIDCTTKNFDLTAYCNRHN